MRATLQLLMAALVVAGLNGCQKEASSSSEAKSQTALDASRQAPQAEPAPPLPAEKKETDVIIQAVEKPAGNLGDALEPSVVSDAVVQATKPTDKTSTYGVYLNGSKMGWMELNLKEVDGKVTYSTQLEATIRGMGAVSDIKLNESRTYNAKTEVLESIEFEQAAATGSVKIRGKRVGAELDWSTSAGGATQTTTLQTADTLKSIKTLRDELKGAKVGDSWNLQVLDASMARDLEVRHLLTQIETRNFAGVESKVYHIKSTYLNAGVEETSLFDVDGELLESKVGGFFKALENLQRSPNVKIFNRTFL